MKRFGWRKIVIGLALAVGCLLVAAAIPITNQAHGEGRGVPENPAFVDPSVPILREISTTLHQMDARLARLELAVQKIQAKSGGSSMRAVVPRSSGGN
jgi:hypothetical protein